VQAISGDQPQPTFDFKADRLSGDGNALQSTTPCTQQDGPSPRAAWDDGEMAGQGLGLPPLTLPSLDREAASPEAAPATACLLASPVQQSQGQLSEMNAAGEGEARIGAPSSGWLCRCCWCMVPRHIVTAVIACHL
jgi:hypothetical protein